METFGAIQSTMLANRAELTGTANRTRIQFATPALDFAWRVAKVYLEYRQRDKKPEEAMEQSGI